MEFAFKIFITFIASLGFALFFNVRRRHVLSATIGGVLTWLVFIIATDLIGGLFIPTLIASTFAAIYAETLAHIFHTPTAVFFIISVIPLIPGRGLYYTMSYAVRGDWAACSSYALSTFTYAAGIAVGICIVTAAVQTWDACREHFREKQEKRERKLGGRRRHEPSKH